MREKEGKNSNFAHGFDSFCWTFTIVEQLRTFSEQTPTFLFAHDLLLLLKITANIGILLTYSSSCTDGMGNH